MKIFSINQLEFEYPESKIKVLNNINLNIEVKDDYVVISVSKKINPITPGLTYIKNDVFNVTESRVIKNE